MVCAAKAKGQRTKAFLHVLKYSTGGILEVNTSVLFFLTIFFPFVQTLILELMTRYSSVVVHPREYESVTSLWVVKWTKNEVMTSLL